MDKLKSWIQALRLRTLPLSVSGIILGLALSPNSGLDNYPIFVFCILTTLLFQILSNLANDLGDSQKGTDNEFRIGPTRAVQSGVISKTSMRNAVIFTSVLSLLSAVLLIYFSYQQIGWNNAVIYFFLALACVVAAILYTIGKNAYGYFGLGDLMVFLFFGLLSVVGTRHLFTNDFNFQELFGALAIGLWSVAVINLNNMRDQENDRSSRKNTMVVKLGFKNAIRYHIGLISMAGISWTLLLYDCLKENPSFWILLGLIPFPLFALHLLKIIKIKDPRDFDPELKNVALTCFLAAFAFFISTLFH